MPRRADIEKAFWSAIKREPGGRQTVTTAEFVKQLARVNWFWSLREANEGTVAKLAMRQPFVLFKGLTFQ
ncbi:hypothetical protein ACSSME_23640, partial [Escherichia coli]